MARGFPVSPDGVQVTHQEITPSADALDPRPTSIYAYGDGTVAMTDEDGVSVVYGVPAGGIWIPFSPVKVTAASSGVVVIGLGKASVPIVTA